MAKKFSAQVDAFAIATEKRMNALIRQSTQELIDEAQLSDDKGGKMRVDTGFLRASGSLSLTGMPSGPIRGDAKTDYPEPTVVGLAQAKVGSTIYFGWTANYARYREAYDGFLGSAVANWQIIVNRVAAEIKRRSPSS